MTHNSYEGILPGELAKSVFVPTVCVIGSPNATAACVKNNVSLDVLFASFSLNVPVHASLRDQTQRKYLLPTLSVKFREINIIARLTDNQIEANLSDVVSKAECPTLSDALLVSGKEDVSEYLQCKDPTPWFNNNFKRAYFNCMRGSPHETFDHPTCVLVVVATSEPDAVAFCMNAYNPVRPPSEMIESQMDPNIPVFYLMIHDQSDDSSDSHDCKDEVYSALQKQFDAKKVYRLTINSSTCQDQPDAHVASLFVDTILHDKPNGNSDDSVNSKSVNVKNSPLPPSPNVPVQHIFGHTSTSTVSPSSTSASTPIPSLSVGGETAKYLKDTDVHNIVTFVTAFVQNAVLPAMQASYLELSNALANTKKGIARSFFSSARRWYGASPQGMASGRDTLFTVGLSRSGRYQYNGIEAKLRRLADLAFMLRDYEMAFQVYQVLRREYQSDKAWLYSAGAQEMAGVCQSILEPARYDTDTYFEIAVSTYRQKCSRTLYADRTVLLQLDHFLVRQQFKDAVLLCVKSTGEDSDLRSGLLLEQAAHYFLRVTPAMYRKYSFHLILAGHRFGKSGHRTHALRCYFQALQILEGKRWSLAEDHIHFTVGRQSFYVNDFPHALGSFSQLLRENKQSSQQEASYLREYLFTLNSSHSHTSTQIQLNSPTSGGKILGGVPSPTTAVCNEGIALASSAEDVAMWASMEETVAERYVTESDKKRWDFPVFRPSVPVLSSTTDNTRHPIVAPNERVIVEFAITNVLRVPLVLKDIKLSCVWSPPSDTDTLTHTSTLGATHKQSSEGPEVNMSINAVDDETAYKCQPLIVLSMEPLETQTLSLVVTPLRRGDLEVIGFEYVINGMVRGIRHFNVKGKRMNDTKKQRMHATYGDDHRLHLKVTDAMPKLLVNCSPLPSSMYAGQVYSGTARFTNTGLAPMKELCVITADPNLIAFDIGKRMWCVPHEERRPTESTVDEGMASEVNLETRIPHAAQENSPLRDIVYSNNAMDKGIIDLMDDSDEALLPGHSITLPFYYRCEDIGDHTFSMLFGYQSAAPKVKVIQSKYLYRQGPNDESEMTWRFEQQQLTTTVTPSLRVSASTLPSPQVAEELLLSVEVENMQQGQQAVYPLHLKQVTCLSAHWSIRPTMTPSRSQEGIMIGSRETLSLFFRLVPNRSAGDNKEPTTMATSTSTHGHQQISTCKNDSVSISPHYPSLLLSSIPLSTVPDADPIPTLDDVDICRAKEKSFTSTSTNSSTRDYTYDCTKPEISQFFLKAMLNANPETPTDTVSMSGWYGHKGGGSAASKQEKQRKLLGTIPRVGRQSPTTPPPSRDSKRNGLKSLANTTNPLPWRRFSSNAGEQTISLVLLWSTTIAISITKSDSAQSTPSATSLTPHTSNLTASISPDSVAQGDTSMILSKVLCQHHVCTIPVGVPAIVVPEVASTLQSTSLIKYILQYPSDFQHDFTKSIVCEIPVKLVMKNSSESEYVDVIVDFLPPMATQPDGADDNVSSTSRFAWVNRSKTSYTIAPDSSLTTETYASCLSPGVYDLTRLRLSARVRNEEVFVVQPNQGQFLVTVLPTYSS
eukprot:CFRG6646T1